MALARMVGRILLGWLFVEAGQRVLRNPAPAAGVSGPLLSQLRARVPVVPADDQLVVRSNAALHVVAGSLLMAGKVPRLAAVSLAGSLVPTTLAAHPFWAISDPDLRGKQKSHFDKNLAICGGLLVLAGASRPPRPTGETAARD